MCTKARRLTGLTPVYTVCTCVSQSRGFECLCGCTKVRCLVYSLNVHVCLRPACRGNNVKRFEPVRKNALYK